MTNCKLQTFQSSYDDSAVGCDDGDGMVDERFQRIGHDRRSRVMQTEMSLYLGSDLLHVFADGLEMKFSLDSA